MTAAHALPTTRAPYPTIEILDEDLVDATAGTVPSGAALALAPVPVDEASRGRQPLGLLLARLHAGTAVARTSWQAASACVSALEKELSARAVLLHVGTSPGSVRTIAARGRASQDVIGDGFDPRMDPAAAAALRLRVPVTAKFGAMLPAGVARRVHAIGARRSVYVAAHGVGDGVALIEVYDPKEPSSARIVDAIGCALRAFAPFFKAASTSGIMAIP
jgi:hypothetical protein